MIKEYTKYHGGGFPLSSMVVFYFILTEIINFNFINTLFNMFMFYYYLLFFFTHEDFFYTFKCQVLPSFENKNI